MVKHGSFSAATFTTQTLTPTTPPPPVPSSKNDASDDDHPTAAAARKNQSTASPAHQGTRTDPTTSTLRFWAGAASHSSRAPPARTFAPRRCGPRRGIPFWEATTRAARRRRARTRGPCSAGGARGVSFVCGRTCDGTHRVDGVMVEQHRSKTAAPRAAVRRARSRARSPDARRGR